MFHDAADTLEDRNVCAAAARTHFSVDPVDAIIASYVQTVESGQVPNRQELLDLHPDLADALRAFFADFDRIHRVASPLRQVGELDATGAVDGTSQTALPTIRYFGDYELLEETCGAGWGLSLRPGRSHLTGSSYQDDSRRNGRPRCVEVQRFRRGSGGCEPRSSRNRADLRGRRARRATILLDEVRRGRLAGESPGQAKHLPGSRRNDRRPRRAPRASSRHFDRDLKPSNVLIEYSGNLVRHRRWPGETAGGYSTTPDRGGPGARHPEVHVPEQAAGRKDLTVAADVYSLGVILAAPPTGSAVRATTS